MNGSNGNGNGNGNQLGGFSPLPPTGSDAPDSDQISVPGVGNIKAGQSAFHTEHAYNRMVYNKLVSAAKMLDHLREEMDRLAIMGDTVAPEDVIAAAGRVVGHGVPAREIATILADMPSQAGQGLAAWVGQQDQALTMQEQHVMQMREVAQYRMGASAMRVLAANHLTQRGQEKAQSAGALGPQPPGAGPAAGPSPGMPQPQVIQMAQAPQQEGSGAGEAV